ncbi:unnamed protein product [Mycena citricolor]|uniref:Uncharacterized protein n=1 Tax=Mycena citricolor TaxID=2018698 RepID=A0AAD2H4U7_9AGAR|nr:unnamed protein product [Mycena citricolor]
MPSRHIVALLPLAWGHTLPYIHLTTRMLALDPELVVTIVQHDNFGSLYKIIPKMLKEFGLCSFDTSRLKIQGVGNKDLQSLPANLEESLKQLTSRWLELLAKAVGGGTNWPKPNTLHLDFCGGKFVLKESGALLGPQGKILFWCSTGVAACIDHFSLFDFNKTAQEIYTDETKQAGRTMDEILGDVGCARNGSDKLDSRILEIVEGVKIYNYKRTAQGAGSPCHITPVMASAQEFAQAADGFCYPTSSPLEPTAVAFAREYYKQRRQELFLVGSQMHDND